MAALNPHRSPTDWLQSQDTWIWAGHLALKALLSDLALPADAALRHLLLGPPLPVTTFTGNTGDVPLGAKLAALDLLESSLTVADDALLGRLVASIEEPDEVRDAAAHLWLRLCGAQRAAELAEYLLTRPSDLLRRWHETVPDAARAALVPHLIAALHGALPELRLRARGLLMAVGEAAVEALAAEVRAAETWQARENAEEALAHLDRHALREALSQREADGRSLSLAEPADSDAARGLSSAEPRERER